MGNIIRGNNVSSNNNRQISMPKPTDALPNGHSREPPRLQPSPQCYSQTNDMLDQIENQITDWQSSIQTMRSFPPEETQRQLRTMMCNTERDLRRINRNIKYSQDQSNSDEDVLHTVLKENDKLQEKTKALESELSAKKEEVVALLLRLSKLASDKLVVNNPAIADLNDRNRPTKLGELYSEIYDNEWTDVFEVFKAKSSEEFAIETLHLTLINVFDFCKSKSDTMLLKTKDAVNFLFEEYALLQQTHKVPHMSMPVKRVSALKLPSKFENDIKLFQRWIDPSPQSHKATAKQFEIQRTDEISNHVKMLQKDVAESMVPVVEEAYMRASWIDEQFIKELKPFVRKCLFLCWMMVVQSPAMCFHQMEDNGTVNFDKTMYKEYTTIGKTVKFVVWPALLLHERGPLVCKGIAQGESVPERG